MKIDLFITYGPKSLKLLYSIMNLNTISFRHGQKQPKQGVCHTVLALPFTFKSMYLKAKEDLWKTQIFHHAKI
jgi:hypothetical protein